MSNSLSTQLQLDQLVARMDHGQGPRAVMDVFTFVMTLVSRLVDIVNVLQEQFNEQMTHPVEFPPLASRPPHHDSDLVTTLQRLHLQLQHSEECSSAMLGTRRRSDERRERSLSAARAYLRNAVEGVPESGRWTVVVQTDALDGSCRNGAMMPETIYVSSGGKCFHIRESCPQNGSCIVQSLRRCRNCAHG